MTVMQTELNGSELKETFAQFPTGVVSVCAEVGGEPVGFVVSTFVGVSLEPPLVGFFVQERSATWSSLRQAPSLGVSILSHKQGPAVQQMAAKVGDRFADLEIRSLGSGAVLLEQATCSVEATVFSEVPVGDHTFVVLKVRAVHRGRGEEEPLVYHRSQLRRLLQRY
jgi:flavin reductase (DIM6/NTAB) family NADH-FMN oxidoreductase RutF